MYDYIESNIILNGHHAGQGVAIIIRYSSFITATRLPPSPPLITIQEGSNGKVRGVMGYSGGGGVAVPVVGVVVCISKEANLPPLRACHIIRKP